MFKHPTCFNTTTYQSGLTTALRFKQPGWY